MDEEASALFGLPQEQEKLWIRSQVLWWGLPQKQEKLWKRTCALVRVASGAG